MLTHHRTTEEEKYSITNWKYEGKYSIYNEKPYEEHKRNHYGFANHQNNFFSFLENENLIGFINLYEEDTEIFFGIGVNPEFCNKGYGQQMTKTARIISHTLFPAKPLYLEVRTWNTRAVHCYEKAGFHIVGSEISQTTSIGEGVFYHMVAE